MNMVEDIEVGVVNKSGTMKEASDRIEFLPESGEFLRLTRQLLQIITSVDATRLSW